MADVDKLNIDSIIQRLLEGKEKWKYKIQNTASIICMLLWQTLTVDRRLKLYWRMFINIL